MLNPFTLQPKLMKAQRELMEPLYTVNNNGKSHVENVRLTGERLNTHLELVEELCSSAFAPAGYKVLQLIGGASNMTKDDYAWFVKFVRAGYLTQVIEMLREPNMTKAFVLSFKNMQDGMSMDVPNMIQVACRLHQEFVADYLVKEYGSLRDVPEELMTNMKRTIAFLQHLRKAALQSF